MKVERWRESWRGVSLVAITYVYFLIFAQFGFLKRLASIGIEGNHLKAVMGAMAAGGILASLLAPQIGVGRSAHRRLQAALSGCALAAGLSLLRLDLVESVAVSFLIGGALGLLTVTLVTHLRLWIGGPRPLLKVGLGTGIGYWVCNDPSLFDASLRTQALVSAAVCILGIGIANRMLPPDTDPPSSHAAPPPFLLVLACFTALVWLDSAAFFIIQNTPALKRGTWEGTTHLWVNGGLHFIAALGSAWLLRRRGLEATLAGAFVFLACACLLLSDPARAALASGFYPIGVSMYSVALVAYPSFLAPAATVVERGRNAGLIYAVAGWVGSALGIGMGQNLGHIPLAFVLTAAALFLSPWLWRFFKNRRRESLVTAALLTIAFGVQRVTSIYAGMHRQPDTRSLVELGHQTYISEGCINCHSQYVRPNSPDVIMWGPTESVDAVRRQQPPLIGNRRQGPDLAEVGDRRSSLWIKAHFINPSAMSHASFMPSYDYLFRDSRGDALVAYMESLGSKRGREHRIQVAQAWSPSPKAVEMAQHFDAAALFHEYCATCHEPDGATRVAWRGSFRRLPPNLATGPLLYVPVSASPLWRLNRISEIVKFGLPGADMPGHEYLPDVPVAAIAEWVAGLSGENNGRADRK